MTVPKMKADSFKIADRIHIDGGVSKEIWPEPAGADFREEYSGIPRRGVNGEGEELVLSWMKPGDLHGMTTNLKSRKSISATDRQRSEGTGGFACRYVKRQSITFTRISHEPA